MKKNKLSNVLSEAIEQAMIDLDACMNDSRYTINFGVYYNPNSIGEGQFGKKTCEVCFAGSVMAKTLLEDEIVKDEKYPEDFGKKNSRMLSALDDIRIGNVDGALDYLDIPYPKGMKLSFDVVEDDYEEFKKSIAEIVVELKKFKL